MQLLENVSRETFSNVSGNKKRQVLNPAFFIE